MATPAAAAGRRVKLYVLTDDGKWDDRGTGFLTCLPDPHTNLFTVRVLAETNGSLLLSSQLHPTEAYYRRPEQNIISWNERPSPNSNSPTEVAVSFADADGCSELWRKILMLENLKPQSHSPRDAQQQEHHQQQQHHQQHHHQQHHQPHQPHQQLHHSTPDDASMPATAHQSSSPQSLHPEHPPPSQPREARAGDANIADTDERETHHAPTSPARLPDVSTAVGAHEPRLFDDTVPNVAWNHDAIEDVLFQEGAGYMILSPSQIPVRVSPTTTTNLAGVEQIILAMSDPDREGLMTLVHLMMQSKVMENQNIRQAFARLVSSSQFISSLCNTFREAEVSGDVELLSVLNVLIRCLFRLGANSVLEVLLNEKYLTDVIGCLEYDEQNLPRFVKALREWKRKRVLREEKKHPASGQRQVSNASSASHVRGDQIDVHARNASEASHAQTGLTDCHSESLSSKNKSSAHQEAVLPALPEGDVTEASSELISSDHQDLKSVDGAEKKTGGDKAYKERYEKKVCFTEQTRQVERFTSTTSKNNDEETTSSGNMCSQDLDKPLVLRRHRDFLQRTVLYKSVISITDASVLAKIHQNYRITYIRDVILSRVSDETSANSLSNLIVFNNVDIIMYFISGNVALREVFEHLNSALDQRRKLRFGSISSNDQKPCSAQNDGTDMMEAQSNTANRENRGTDFDKNSSQTRNREEISTDEKEKGTHSCRATASTNSSRSRATQAVSDTIMTSSRDASTTTRVPFNASGKDGKKAVCDTGACDMKSSERSVDTRSELKSILGFLKELCGIVRGQQLGLKDRFYYLLFELGILEVILVVLEEDDSSLRTLACDILSATIIHNPAEVRNRILKNVTQQDSSAPRKQQANQNVTSVEFMMNTSTASIHSSRARQGKAEESVPSNTSKNSEDGKVNQMTCKPRPDENMSREVHATGSVVEECSESRDKEHGAETSPVMTEGVDKENEGPETEGPETEEKGRSETGKERCEKGKVNESTASEGRRERETMIECGLSPQSEDRKRKRYRPTWRVEIDFPLINVMMKIICEDSESGLVLCMLDMVRALVDPMSMRGEDKAQFLEMFYGNFARRLLTPIGESAAWLKEGRDAINMDSVGYLCDMLSFLVVNHDFHARYFVIGFNVGAKVCALLQHPRAHVRLAAIRFVRTCVGMCEDLYDRHLVQRGLVGQVMDVFARNGGRENLTQSAILELMSFVTRRGRGLVLREVVEQYGDVLAGSAPHSGVYGDARRRWEELRREGGWEKAMGVVVEERGVTECGGRGGWDAGQAMMGVMQESSQEGRGWEGGAWRLSLSSVRARARREVAATVATATMEDEADDGWQADSGGGDGGVHDGVDGGDGGGDGGGGGSGGAGSDGGAQRAAEGGGAKRRRVCVRDGAVRCARAVIGGARARSSPSRFRAVPHTAGPATFCAGAACAFACVRTRARARAAPAPSTAAAGAHRLLNRAARPPPSFPPLARLHALRPPSFPARLLSSCCASFRFQAGLR